MPIEQLYFEKEFYGVTGTNRYDGFQLPRRGCLVYCADINKVLFYQVKSANPELHVVADSKYLPPVPVETKKMLVLRSMGQAPDAGKPVVEQSAREMIVKRYNFTLELTPKEWGEAKAAADACDRNLADALDWPEWGVVRQVKFEDIAAHVSRGRNPRASIASQEPDPSQFEYEGTREKLPGKPDIAAGESLKAKYGGVGRAVDPTEIGFDLLSRIARTAFDTVFDRRSLKPSDPIEENRRIERKLRNDCDRS